MVIDLKLPAAFLLTAGLEAVLTVAADPAQATAITAADPATAAVPATAVVEAHQLPTAAEFRPLRALHRRRQVQDRKLVRLGAGQLRWANKFGVRNKKAFLDIEEGLFCLPC